MAEKGMLKAILQPEPDACAGLVFFNLPQDAAHAQSHLALLFFVLLLYQLLPFCYVRSP